MKIDKRTVDKLADLPDELLWKTILALGNQSGIDLSGVKVTGSELSKIRDAMTHLTDADIVRAMEILQNCKGK